MPDPDAAPPDTTKPVKVFIIAGQSNMVGMGTISGPQPGTLDTVVKREHKFPHLVDGTGNWTTRNDVHYTSTAVAQKLDGSVIWRWGDPDSGRKKRHHDVACQINTYNP